MWLREGSLRLEVVQSNLATMTSVEGSLCTSAAREAKIGSRRLQWPHHGAETPRLGGEQQMNVGSHDRSIVLDPRKRTIQHDHPLATGSLLGKVVCRQHNNVRLGASAGEGRLG